MQLQKTNVFTVDVKFQMPGEAPNVWRPAQFQARFKTMPQDELDQLREEQDDKGFAIGLLDRVLVDVQGVETSEVKEDGTPYTPIEIVKLNQFSSVAASIAFWEAVGRDVERKNLKTQRGR